MLRIIKTEAIVFKKNTNLLHKDSLITLFTQEHGKLKVFAKGIKKVTSRRLPHSQTGNLIKAIISRKDSFFYLQETELISHFSELKKDKTKINILYFYFFILDRLLPENQKETLIYNLTKRFLIELSRSKTFEQRKIVFYLNKILTNLGYSDKELVFEEAVNLIEELINEKLPAFVI